MPVLCRRLAMLRPSPLVGFLTSSTVRTSYSSCSFHNVSARNTSKLSESVTVWRSACRARLYVAFTRSSPFTYINTQPTTCYNWWSLPSPFPMSDVIHFCVGGIPDALHSFEFQKDRLRNGGTVGSRNSLLPLKGTSRTQRTIFC